MLMSCDLTTEENSVFFDCLYYGKEFPKPKYADSKKNEEEHDGEEIIEEEKEWRSALKEIIEDKETWRHMYVLLTQVKEELTEAYNWVRTPKGLPFD
mmetsp:Transcript_3280/g.2835  ORF Transcript_3280/g.2835 Transcript_3280/m.2835 type:complete len:97 (+) Transcript_3280:69-359(+)|eukprot:CAMPEP_0114600654 /NCGR_PEP_ID=MMETSP0125-20121206/23248_1 /TAXON_ID=485358 ORGANISM="Aristerostoma sp., Strain ATCC 50986" /NCGR_SAMPLE_ID=MMETSP0125 /ASSEMBLY_ACC=CAM_ASM_000245 /LENGTH=96 /DNA_ID=CAMNT_0001809049 /DNA_START=48 /DNA_END=338 /DNA_ORIENTATION=+